ncbi:hypothetical protein Ddye_025509 [Dipteronia dyeriana]|uniref:Myb/SANT-like domain-containing protein n=1 Tax=Dipteronia dyeriana TaxID=168575 RepID=A0AAD9TLB4_9ROSI|nr:hypothetical protein Ddye_025509 [Dipteronia dyeriana]
MTEFSLRNFDRASNIVSIRRWVGENVASILSYLVIFPGDLQTSTFTKKVWGVIDDKVLADTGKRYTIPKLKAKFNRFRKKHREFSDLLDHTGFGWNPISNTVTAFDDVWKEYLKVSISIITIYYKIKYTIKTGHMHFSSNQIPPSSDEERELEEIFVTSGVHVNNIEDIDESEHPSGGNKAKGSDNLEVNTVAVVVTNVGRKW